MIQKFDFAKIMNDMQRAFKLTDKEKEAYSKSPAFKILAYIPYIAKCKDADRCAYANLSSAILASRLGKESVATFREEDLSFLEKRLEYLFHFIDGDKRIINKGKALLKYNMLLDYQLDYHKDSKNRKSNPMFYSSFNFEKEEKKLLKEIGYDVTYDVLFDETALVTIEKLSFWMLD